VLHATFSWHAAPHRHDAGTDLMTADVNLREAVRAPGGSSGEVEHEEGGDNASSANEPGGRAQSDEPTAVAGAERRNEEAGEDATRGFAGGQVPAQQIPAARRGEGGSGGGGAMRWEVMGLANDEGAQAVGVSELVGLLQAFGMDAGGDARQLRQRGAARVGDGQRREDGRRQRVHAWLSRSRLGCFVRSVSVSLPVPVSVSVSVCAGVCLHE